MYVYIFFYIYTLGYSKLILVFMSISTVHNLSLVFRLLSERTDHFVYFVLKPNINKCFMWVK